MKKLTLKRFYQNEHGTLGELMIGDLPLFIVERPWFDNKPYKSCVPAGTYQVVKRDGSNKNLKYPDAWEIKVGAPRWGIVFHVANYPDELAGCLAPNSAAVVNSSGIRGKLSIMAMAELDSYLSGETEFTLEIIDPC